MLYNELDTYFRIRFEELFNKCTPDSYRVRNHNVLSVLDELCELIEGWQKHRIQTPETVVLCAQECVELIEEDQWIDYSFYDKKLFVDDIGEYIKILPENKDKRENIYEISSKLRYACRKCIDTNQDIYANTLFDFLIGEINKPGDMDKDGRYKEEMESFDKALCIFCNELLRLGYAKNHIYLKANKLLRGELTIDNIRSQFLSQIQNKTTYEVIFKFQANDFLYLCQSEYGFTDNIDDIKEKLTNQKGDIPFKTFLDNKGRKLFKIFVIKTLDTYSAVKEAKDSLALLLDTLHLGNNNQVGVFESRVLVISKAPTGGYYSELRTHDYQLDGDYQTNSEMTKLLKAKVDNILESRLVKDDVKERLKSALRHLRMANDSKDLESRFVNYWIALEFIFSSPISHENTFTRIKKHLVNVLCYSYISRNVRYLDSLLKKDGALAENESIVNKAENEWGAIIDKVTDKRTQYRLCQMKANLRSKDSIANYAARHRQHLEWHIARIYRMRNELIHEAALKQDIEGTTSNLRFYLVFLLNQMVDFFYDVKMTASINDFFHHYENKTNVIFVNKDRDYALNAEYEVSLIR